MARPFARGAFSLAKTCSIGLRSGEYLGRNSRRAPAALIALSHRLSFVRSEIVEHDDVVALEGRNEELFDVGEKALAVDGAVEQAGRLDAVVAQSGQERRGLPVAVRDLGDEPSAARRPAVEAGHVGLGPGLVDEDEPRRIDAPLMASPAQSMALHVRAVLLARDERLFLSVTPMTAQEAAHQRGVGLDAALGQQPVAQRLQRDVGFLRPQALRGSRDAAPASDVCSRPSCAAVREPLRSKRSTHLIAEDSLTPNRAAAARRLIPPDHDRVDHPVAQILRISSSHPCWPPPSQQVESEQARFGNLEGYVRSLGRGLGVANGDLT